MKAIEELLRTVLATGGCKLLAIREEGGAAATSLSGISGPLTVGMMWRRPHRQA